MTRRMTAALSISLAGIGLMAVTSWEKLTHPLIWPIDLGSPERLLQAMAEKYSHPQEVAYASAHVLDGLDELEQSLVAGPMARRGRVLDVGCGVGREAIALAKAGYAVVGIDLAPGAVEAARRHAASQGVDITFRTMAAHEVTPDVGQFDYVLTTVGFYSLIPTYALRIRTLQALADVLTPGGRIFLAAPWMPPSYRPGLRADFVDGLRRLRRLIIHDAFETEPGDQLIGVISPASQTRERVFRHVFFRPEEIEHEIRAAGLAGTPIAEGLWKVHRP